MAITKNKNIGKLFLNSIRLKVLDLFDNLQILS